MCIRDRYQRRVHGNQREMSNPAYKTANGKYGEKWLTTDKLLPVQEDVPTYSQIGEKDLIVKHSMRVYKNEKIKEILAASEKERNEQEELELRMSTVPIKSKEFPVEEGKITYPSPSNYTGNPLYKTSGMIYGDALPQKPDLPNHYYPRSTQFTTGFLGHNFSYSGLQTAKTNHGVAKHFDGYFGQIFIHNFIF
eukprot:TRINITY_DN22694_c0_g1_i2.p1 TRINITY_DN22694_c0_g1~~TRINITY_DN22694_c0_g1_i2.p1  ORF type:complete len:194 (-),score=30.78 TRINITY_DN22694_c0_g1_i2:54-635(-)